MPFSLSAHYSQPVTDVPACTHVTTQADKHTHTNTRARVQTIIDVHKGK